MPRVKARQLREKTLDELVQHEAKLREQIFKLRFQKATGQVESPQRIVAARRELARVLTVIGERSSEGR
ncbi:MAG: 50S ribosomal protein L29 [Acidobacteriota bacterium]